MMYSFICERYIEAGPYLSLNFWGLSLSERSGTSELLAAFDDFEAAHTFEGSMIKLNRDDIVYSKL